MTGYIGFNSSQVGYKLTATKERRISKWRFNSSQVGYKRECIYDDMYDYAWFQFLIGRLQTCSPVPAMLFDTICFNSSQVGYKPYHGTCASICTNCFNSSQVGYKPLFDYLFCRDENLFQFLIGRLQTNPLGHQPKFYLCRFNSSQVGYKLHMRACPFLLYHFSFNSSQVGYKLSCQKDILSDSTVVSIPHRQATNTLFGGHEPVPQLGFNSSQVGYKRYTIEEKEENEKSFNSSQVGYKLIRRQRQIRQ